MEDIHDSNPNQQKNTQSSEMAQVHSDDHAIEESLLLNDKESNNQNGLNEKESMRENSNDKELLFQNQDMQDNSIIKNQNTSENTFKSSSYLFLQLLKYSDVTMSIEEISSRTQALLRSVGVKESMC